MRAKIDFFALSKGAKAEPVRSRKGARITKLLPLEFRARQRLAPLLSSAPAKVRLLVAVSGGADSMALAEVLRTLSTRMDFSLALVHVDHGYSASKATMRYRAKTSKLVMKWARDKKVDCFIVKNADPKRELKSEADLREFRHEVLRQLKRNKKFSFVVFAHHAEDLFETRVLRLIRGTGLAGLVAMEEMGDGVLRPFLQESRAEIRLYAQGKNCPWIEDPSNADQGPLRNWLRNTWLPALDKKRPGATKSFRRSLAILAAQIAAQIEQEKPKSLSSAVQSLALSEFRALPPQSRYRWLMEQLREIGVFRYTSGQLREVDKRLLSTRLASTNAKFEVMGVIWRVNAKQISALAKRAPAT